MPWPWFDAFFCLICSPPLTTFFFHKDALPSHLAAPAPSIARRGFPTQNKRIFILPFSNLSRCIVVKSFLNYSIFFFVFPPPPIRTGALLPPPHLSLTSDRRNSSFRSFSLLHFKPLWSPPLLFLTLREGSLPFRWRLLSLAHPSLSFRSPEANSC